MEHNILTKMDIVNKLLLHRIKIRNQHLLLIAVLLMRRRFLLIKRRNQQRNNRRWWVKPHNTIECRYNFGAHHKVFRYFKTNDHEEFFKCTRMSVPQFDMLHDLIEPRIRKRSNREALSIEVRLAVTLSFLAHGDSIASTAWNFRIGKSTVYKIIPKMCKVIWEVLQALYLKCPHQAEEWTKIADDFFEVWNFPNCIGAIDGKHCDIQAPPNSGSAFHNYKGYFSFVLMAIADARYRFIWVDIGDYGSYNDAGIWANSVMSRALHRNAISIPPARVLPNTNIPVQFCLVVDEGFPLKTYLMHPYARKNLLGNEQRIFNYRLSRARRVVENAFGILVSRWRVLETPLAMKLETNEAIVQAYCCLHNYIINTSSRNNRYLHEDGQISDNNNCLKHLGRIGANSSAVAATRQRDILAKYFMSKEGSIPQQWQHTI